MSRRLSTRFWSIGSFSVNIVNKVPATLCTVSFYRFSHLYRYSVSFRASSVPVLSWSGNIMRSGYKCDWAFRLHLQRHLRLLAHCKCDGTEYRANVTASEMANATVDPIANATANVTVNETVNATANATANTTTIWIPIRLWSDCDPRINSVALRISVFIPLYLLSTSSKLV